MPTIIAAIGILTVYLIMLHGWHQQRKRGDRYKLQVKELGERCVRLAGERDEWQRKHLVLSTQVRNVLQKLRGEG